MIDLPPPSPAAIAAAVRRPAALQAGEHRLQELRARRDELQLRAVGLVSKRSGTDDSAINRDLRAIEAERLALEDEIREARDAVTKPRQQYAAAVAEVLAPVIAEEARRALNAVTELCAAIRLLDAADAAKRRTTGEPRDRHYPDLGDVEDWVRAVARRP